MIWLKEVKKHCIPIHLRPRIINERSELGHWEGDSITMSQNGERIITLVERQSRYAITFKSYTQNVDKNFELFKNNLLSKTLPIKSIIFDNGVEFNQCYKLKHYGIKVYYYHPYAPSERWTNKVWIVSWEDFYQMEQTLD